MPQVDPERARGERVDELLDALEAVPAAEREDLLARICPDPELRREVLSLLAAESESRGSLQRFAQRLVARLDAAPDLAGRHVGTYRLVRPIGHGGMGVVYEAERVDGTFEQRVALKLLTTALAGTEARNRFLAERQILARLEHPAIARIVDGGVTEDGTPWFAMEHVAGVPIDVYCDQRRLDIRQRLEIFLQVCDAVEHAHRRLVVHRDLKPANVLVTEDDALAQTVGRGGPTPPAEGGTEPTLAAPKVKLLDFGIAKLLAVDGAGATAPPTRTALRLMTPEYASPEQVRGEPVTTASDVYQLGLLLYELLTGRRPYALQRRAGGEIGRAICEQAPARPSTTFSRARRLAASDGASEPTVHAICRARRTSPSRLQRRLRGDLENIVLTALRKDPERRYGSADRLAQDIRRHLGGLPVTARADTWVYRGRKFLQRHALGAGAAALMFLFAAGMTGFYMARIQGERNRAEIERDRAQAEAAKAEQMNQFLTGLFRGPDPREPGGRELTARELLDRGVEQVNRELAEQPGTQAAMLHVLGSTYSVLAHFDAAERLLTRALELRRRLDPDSSDVAETLGEIGGLRFRQDRYEHARQHLEEAAAMLESSGSRGTELSLALNRLGATYWRLGDHKRSLATLEQALAIQERTGGGNSEPAAYVLQNIGGLLWEMGDLERAEDAFERVLVICRRQLRADHFLVGSALRHVAMIKHYKGEDEEAEALFRDAIEAQRRTYGPDQPSVGEALNSLGSFLNAAGRGDEAIEVLQQAVDIYTATGLASSRDAAFPLVNLGDAYRDAGRLHDARRSYQQGVTALEAIFGAGQFDRLLAYGLARLGAVEAELGERAAADRTLSRALEVWSRAPETIDPELVPPLLDLSHWLIEQRRCQQAVPLLRRALRSQTVEYPRSGPDVAELERLMADCS